MSQSWVACPAPAKINLFLHVTGRRADGYHDLQTVFQLLEHGDQVRVRARGDGRVVRRVGPPGVAEADDLGVRAARALVEHVGGAPGADLVLDKRLPMGGGLGGGSSNAATVLVALDRLWDLGLGVDALAALGLDLGADVPVFVRGASAWAEGVGEHLQPVAIDPAWYLVVTPPVQVSTVEVFTDPALTRNTPRIKMGDFLREEPDLRGGRRPRLSAAALVAATWNDCEAVVRARHPQVGEVLDWLSARAPARMTGTGASAFALVGDEAEARALHGELPSGWAGFVARGVNESPMSGP